MAVKRVTIYDIAAETGLSASTVSRVLGNSDYPVGPELREKIIQAAKELDYHPNLAARNLKTKNSRHIGVVIPSVANPFYPSVLRGIEDVAFSRDYTFTVCSCDHNPERESEYLKQMIENNVAGIITVFTQPSVGALKRYIQRGGVVLSIYSESPVSKDFISFCFDHSQQAYEATKHLIDLGHRRIGLLSPSLSNPIRRLKVEGYKRALADAGIGFEPLFCHIASSEVQFSYKDSSAESQIGYNLAEKMLTETPDITGLVCMNDMVALGCLSALKDHGHDVPGEYSVIGFDDLFFCGLVTPKITTVRMEKYRLGQFAMETIVGAVETGSEQQSYTLRDFTYLVVRESTGKPR